MSVLMLSEEVKGVPADSSTFPLLLYATFDAFLPAIS